MQQMSAFLKNTWYLNNVKSYFYILLFQQSYVASKFLNLILFTLNKYFSINSSNGFLYFQTFDPYYKFENSTKH